MTGRKPKPTENKRLAGNPGKRRLNDAEPEPALVIPAAPEHLDAVARAEWERVTRELHALGIVAELYRGPLAAYCTVYSRWVSAEQQIESSGGPVLKSTDGGLYQNPHLSVANRAIQQMQSLAAEFGMTPSSKSRVKAVKPAGQSSLKVFAAKRGA